MINDQDLIVIGGGIMGLMTAYYASLMGKRVTILEKSYLGNKKAASFSLTRSIRNDYLDPYYTKLAYEARFLWKLLQEQSPTPFIVECGLLNMARKDITSDLAKTYAMQSLKNISALGIRSKNLSKKSLKKLFPQFNVDLGCLDEEAGFLYLPTITKLLLNLLKQSGVKILENVNIKSIEAKSNKVYIDTSSTGSFITDKLVITSGIWVNEVLKLIKGCKLQFPITPDRPKQCKYYIPSKQSLSIFTSDKMPVFAYLDIGIYGHPIYKSLTPGVKIGYYNPPGIKKQANLKVKSIGDFVRLCIPTLKNARVIDVTDTDQCYYDLVEDNEFILGKIPGYNCIFVGAGWNGTGYKFAPLVGKILAQLAIQGQTVYDIARFSPERFKNYD